ncbi:MAG: hypothetical protein RR851_14320 [Clostridium sp.]
MDRKLKEAIVITVVTFVMTSFLNILLSNFTFDRGYVRVGNLTEAEKGEYIMSIDVINFSNENLDKIRIKIPQDINIGKVKTSEPLNLNKINNNVGYETVSIYEIDRIPEKKQVTLNIILNNKIDIEDIVIDKNSNKISVEYPDDINSSLAEKQLKQLLIYSITVSFIFGISVYILLYINEKKIKKLKESRAEDKDYHEEKMKDLVELKEQYKDYWEEKDKEVKEIMKKMESLNKEITDIKVASKKRELLCLSRIKDYKKELDFWRDTIRKVFYKSQNKKIDPEAIFDEVTNNLKTYQTKNKNCEDFDMIKVMSNIIKDE